MISFDRPIAYHREFVQFGGIKAAVFLSQAFYWHNRTDDPDGWFYKTREEWQEETGMTRKEQETSRKALKEMGILQEEQRGRDRWMYYRIDTFHLEKLLTDASAQKVPFHRSESYQCNGTKVADVYNTSETTTETTTESIPFSEIIEILNKETGKRYQARSAATKRLIKARWREGYRLDDFREVIRKKVAEWGKDPKMSQYLRPETLFGTKFESYLNQADSTIDPEKGIWIGHMQSQEEKNAWLACRKANGGRPPMSREEVLEFMRMGA